MLECASEVALTRQLDAENAAVVGAFRTQADGGAVVLERARNVAGVGQGARQIEVSLDEIRLVRERLAVKGNGFGGLAFAAQRDRQVVQSLGRLGVESDRSAQARESFAGLAVEEQGVAERGEIGGVARLNLHEDPELRDRLAMMAAFEQLRGE